MHGRDPVLVAADETRWSLAVLKGPNDALVRVTVVLPSSDPEMVKTVERIARMHGLTMPRLEEPAE